MHVSASIFKRLYFLRIFVQFFCLNCSGSKFCMCDSFSFLLLWGPYSGLPFDHLLLLSLFGGNSWLLYISISFMFIEYIFTVPLRIMERGSRRKQGLRRISPQAPILGCRGEILYECVNTRASAGYKSRGSRKVGVGENS